MDSLQASRIAGGNSAIGRRESDFYPTPPEVTVALMDKCGWHVFEETADSRDTHSIAYLYECLEKLAEEINEGRIKRKHIKDVLKDECGVVFGEVKP